METVLSLFLGLGLSAACGFRVFVPVLVMGLAARTGHLTLAADFDWIGGTPALVALSVATFLEIGAYYIPWLDNLLDAVATPAAVVAGIVVTASVVTGIDPYLKWTLAVIAGGGVAGAVQALTVGARQTSAVSTGGVGNPLVSTVELGSSFFTALLALLTPVVVVIAVAPILIYVVRRYRRRRAPA